MMNIRRIITMVLLCAVLLATPLVLFSSTAHAATAEACGKQSSDLLNFPTWYKYLNPVYDPVAKECDIEFNFPENVGKVLLALVEIMLRIAALVAVGFIIYAGFQFLLTQGEPDKAKSARETIFHALVGLVICVSAVGVVNLIGGALLESTPGDTPLPATPINTNSVQALLQVVFGMAGGIAMIVITVAGIRYMLSQGDPQKAATAKNTIIYALVGLVVALSAFSVVTFVMGNIL